MEPRAHHVLIGLFTITVVAAALLFALWLGQSSRDREYSYYVVGFDRAVSGLNEGNAVQYSGIRVGDVVELSLDPEDPRYVRALIRVYSDVPVKQDTRATLVLANISGSMRIQLQGGTPQSPRLTGSRDDPPVIEAEPSSLSSILSNSEELFGKVDQLLSNANRILSEENADRLSRILADLENISSDLAGDSGNPGQLAATLEGLNRGAAQAEEALTAFTRLGEEATTLLDEQGSRILDSTRSMMDSLEQTAARVDELTRTHAGSLNQGLDGLGELAPALRELRSTLGNLRRITRNLEESPGDFFFGGDRIEEFSP